MSKKNNTKVDIPIWAIIASFFIGLWPIGVILIIAKTIAEAEAEERKKEAETKKEKTHTVYHSGYVDKDVEEKIKSTYFYANSQETVEPDTTYHYSYVKKDAEKAEEGGKSNKKTSSRKKNYVKQKFSSSTEQKVANVFMWIGCAISVLLLVDTISNVVAQEPIATLSDVVTRLAVTAVTAVLYVLKEYYKSRDYRIMTYLSLLRCQRFYSVEKLAEVVDLSVSRVMKDLHYMQSKGLLGEEAIIDKKIRYVILAPSAIDEAKAEYERENGIENREARRRDDGKIDSEDYEKTLLRIRELNDDIDDPTVSEKIDTIEELTRKIFKLVEEKPSLKPQLESFLSYYLPTTLKLLDSYAYFEEQGIRGENIDAGMRNIEETLDMLIVGYQTQLDKLFKSQTMDVTTDINVLEQMMKADGFTENNDFDFSSSGAFAEMTDPEKKKSE